MLYFYLPCFYFYFFSVRETHEIAEAQQEKNAKLREAFGISEYFVEGSSLDPQRKAKEAAAKAAAEDGNAKAVATQRYELVHTPSPTPEKETKKRKRRDRSK